MGHWFRPLESMVTIAPGNFHKLVKLANPSICQRLEP
jgi:hypothetical protein